MRDNDEGLSQRIKVATTEEPVTAALTTSESVLARITDGIYRQPASALRELISNSYDADAREVVIITDAPRFSSITIRDDGIGLSPAALAHLIHNIGGSAKRTRQGSTLEITSREDPTHSPSGRKLIGKLGIGLFSVAQFTRHFIMITKQSGDKFRTIVDITLGMPEEVREQSSVQKEYETGQARIYREAVGDSELESRGTEIRLLELLPRTRAELSSSDMWTKIDIEKEHEGIASTRPPQLHIGRVDPQGIFAVPPSLPWSEMDSPEERFLNLHEFVRRSSDLDRDSVNLEALLDRYLYTIWILALSAPLPYIGGHPFDLWEDSELITFKLDNSLKGQASKLGTTSNIRETLGLTSPGKLTSSDHFEVIIDGIRLSRPITFRDQPRTASGMQTPLLFVGKCTENFTGKPISLSGGSLSFEAYLFWRPKVVPTQHQGVMVRVGDASGTLFDKTFMGYPISEQNRLRQITAEIFVSAGFDAAINLDRESYNFSHPHYQFILKWLHSAIRQLTNRQKELAKGIRSKRIAEEGEKKKASLAEAISTVLQRRGIEDVPRVQILDDSSADHAAELRRTGSVVLRRTRVIPQARKKKGRVSARESRNAAMMDRKAIAIGQILAAWGLLESLEFESQESLVRELLEIMTIESSN